MNALEDAANGHGADGKRDDVASQDARSSGPRATEREKNVTKALATSGDVRGTVTQQGDAALVNRCPFQQR